MTELEERCPDCEGRVLLEQADDASYWVCQDCGAAIKNNNLVLEEQEQLNEEGEYEVME